MDISSKLRILSDAAKYDASCSSSGSSRGNMAGGIGNAALSGICHSFTPDGRCVSLLKVLLSNRCVYDCEYCKSRRTSEIERADFTPKELADLTINFYRRNYIEGLFLSSAVHISPDHTTELMIKTVRILREEYRFNGYIHAKGIPGASSELIYALGLLCDRISVNIELPSSASLAALAPQKSKQSIVSPMKFITSNINQNKSEIVKYRHAPKFAPAGQSTQLIVGASPESDYDILTLTQNLYDRFSLKRVYYSGYIPLIDSPLLPALGTPPPLLREHRLYQADWLLRFYGFRADEILSADAPHLNEYVDPKCGWALRNLDSFPLEINTAPYEMLLRIPGIGVKGANIIDSARRFSTLDFEDLKKMKIVLKRAQYFITCKGRYHPNVKFEKDSILRGLLSDNAKNRYSEKFEQLTFFENKTLAEEEIRCLIEAI